MLLAISILIRTFIVHGELVVDTSRQASVSLAVYAYKVCRSLLECLSLNEGEALELEGNEDFDCLRAAEATTSRPPWLDAARCRMFTYALTTLAAVRPDQSEIP